jgi:hypothetical protein
MRTMFVALLLTGLLACSASTDSSGLDDQTIDAMRLVNVQSFFTVGTAYDVAAYWKAYNTTGRELPLRDSTGAYINRSLRYGIDDSLPANSTAVDSTKGTITLPAFTGRLYLFAPTARSPRERMGSHFMTVSQ